jgi:hypothetical protein
LEPGQPPGVGGANGQQTETHAFVPVASTIAVLVALEPDPLTMPGSPDPVSLVVPYQSPSTKPVLAVATSETSPSATQAVMVGSADGDPPAIATEHQLSKLSTVSATGVDPLHAAPPAPEEELVLEVVLLVPVVLDVVPLVLELLVLLLPPEPESLVPCVPVVPLPLLPHAPIATLAPKQSNPIHIVLCM